MAKRWMKIFIGYDEEATEDLKWTATTKWQAPTQVDGRYIPSVMVTGATVKEALLEMVESEAFQEELRVMEGRDDRPHEG